MSDRQGDDDHRDVLPFAFLVYREDSPRWGPTWIARSVLTGHLAEARSAESALTNLRRAIDAAILMATGLGQTPKQWYDAQEMDEPEFMAKFCRLVPHGVERRSLDLAISGCRLEATIAGAA